MTLSFDINQLNAFIAQLSSLSADAAKGATYSGDWVRETAQGHNGQVGQNCQRFCDTTDQVADALTGKLTTVQSLLYGAANAVSGTAKGYQSVDRQHAEQIETTFGGHYGGPGLPTVSDTPEPVPSDLSTMLDAAPSDGTVIPDLFFELLNLLGIDDMPSVVATTLTELIHLDKLIDDFSKTFMGDWNVANQSATALDQLKTFCNGMADSLNDARIAVAYTWEGNAAESADNWMRRMVASLDEFGPALSSVAQNFREVSAGMQSGAALIGTMIDELVVIIITMIVSLVFAGETAGLSLAAVAVEAAAGVASVTEISGACLVLIDTVEGLTWVCGDYLGAINSVETMSQPGTFTTPLTMPSY